MQQQQRLKREVREKEVLDLMRQYEDPWTITDLAESMDLSKPHAGTVLKRLRADGKVGVVGHRDRQILYVPLRGSRRAQEARREAPATNGSEPSKYQILHDLVELQWQMAGGQKAIITKLLEE